MSAFGCRLCGADECLGCLDPSDRGRLPDESFTCWRCRGEFASGIYLDGADGGGGYRTICEACSDDTNDRRPQLRSEEGEEKA